MIRLLIILGVVLTISIIVVLTVIFLIKQRRKRYSMTHNEYDYYPEN